MLSAGCSVELEEAGADDSLELLDSELLDEDSELELDEDDSELDELDSELDESLDEELESELADSLLDEAADEVPELASVAEKICPTTYNSSMPFFLTVPTELGLVQSEFGECSCK